jgi:hypothetical protein
VKNHFWGKFCNLAKCPFRSINNPFQTPPLLCPTSFTRDNAFLKTKKNNLRLVNSKVFFDKVNFKVLFNLYPSILILLKLTPLKYSGERKGRKYFFLKEIKFMA